MRNLSQKENEHPYVDNPERKMSVNIVDPTEQSLFQKRLKTVAKKVGGVAELSRMSGVAEGTLNKYFLSKPKEPSRAILSKIIKSTDISADWLLLGAMQSNAPKDSVSIPYFDQKIYDELLGGTYDVAERERLLLEAYTRMKANSCYTIDTVKADSYFPEGSELIVLCTPRVTSNRTNRFNAVDFLVRLGDSDVTIDDSAMVRYAGANYFFDISFSDKDQAFTLEDRSKFENRIESQKLEIMIRDGRYYGKVVHTVL